VTKLITQVPAASFNDKFSVFLSSISLHHYGMWNTPKMVRGPENHTVSCSVIHWGYDFLHLNWIQFLK
jgi:hypothetical protein